MKQKNKKLVIFICILLLSFSLFIFLTFKSYDYEKEYSIDEYRIIEKYNKEEKYYTFYINNNNNTYPYIIQNKYLKQREIIKDIEVYKNETEICILPKSDELEFYPVCKNQENIYSYNLSEVKDIKFNYKETKKTNKEYKNININSLNETSFLIYNYKGFYLINSKDNKNIKLFEQDVYTLDLVYQKNHYILIPDYDLKYYFNKFYLINILNGKVEEIETDYEISYESVFLGDFKNNIYLIDKKEEKEYKINLRKNKVEQIEPQILKDNKFVKTDIKKIIKDNINFIKESVFKYEIKDNTLYQIINDIQIQISNLKVDRIIKIDNNNIYYLSGENLYMYNSFYGEVLLLSNFEWNFNNTNMIYLYK